MTGLSILVLAVVCKTINIGSIPIPVSNAVRFCSLTENWYLNGVRIPLAGRD